MKLKKRRNIFVCINNVFSHNTFIKKHRKRYLTHKHEYSESPANNHKSLYERKRFPVTDKNKIKHVFCTKKATR